MPAADLNGPKYRQAARPFSGALVLGVEQLAPIEALVEVHQPSVRLVDLSAAVVRVLPGILDGAPPFPLAAAGPGGSSKGDEIRRTQLLQR